MRTVPAKRWPQGALTSRFLKEAGYITALQGVITNLQAISQAKAAKIKKLEEKKANIAEDLKAQIEIRTEMENLNNDIKRIVELIAVIEEDIEEVK